MAADLTVPRRAAHGNAPNIGRASVDEAPPIDVPGAQVAKVEGPRQWLTFPAGASAAPVVAAVAASYDVADLSIQEPDIEDVIRQIYSRGLSGMSQSTGLLPGGTT